MSKISFISSQNYVLYSKPDSLEKKGLKHVNKQKGFSLDHPWKIKNKKITF